MKSSKSFFLVPASILMLTLFICCIRVSGTYSYSSESTTVIQENPPHGALLDKNGAIMRGTPMVLGKALNQSVAFAEDISNWKYLQNSGFNTIRICWVDPYYWNHNHSGWTVKEVLPHLDKVVNNATAVGMNLIINFHNVGAQQEYDKSYQFTLENEFWKEVAPRYKDNDLVYYEPANEPTFTMSDYLKMDFKKPYLELYSTIHQLAPNRQILLFSFNGITSDIIKVVDDYEGFIDWTHTTIAYHMYNSTSSEAIKSLMERHPVMCTEWFYDHVSRLPGNEFIKRVDGYKLNAQTLEKIGSGWCDWRDWGDITLNETIDTLIGDAMSKDYWWGKPVKGLRADGMTICTHQLQLAAGQHKKISAFGIPALAENAQPKWSTSDARIATVDENGNVTGVSPGHAVISATVRLERSTLENLKVSGLCEITVK